MSGAVPGPMLMLIVDASTLYEVVTTTARGRVIDLRLQQDSNWAAPHIVDVEVFGVIRRDFRLGRLDRTGASLGLQNLRSWPGERFGHRAFLERAWDFRNNVRGSDAMYVALAEALNGTLITTDQRLARAAGSYCAVEVAPA